MEFADPFTCRSTCTESLMLDVIMVFVWLCGSTKYLQSEWKLTNITTLLSVFDSQVRCLFFISLISYS